MVSPKLLFLMFVSLFCNWIHCVIMNMRLTDNATNATFFFIADEKEEGILGSILLPSFHISMLSVDDHINRKYAFKVSARFCLWGTMFEQHIFIAACM